MPVMEAQETGMRFRRLAPSQEVDDEGNMPVSSAFELIKQVGKESEVFAIGLVLVQRSSLAMSRSEKVEEKVLQKFIALVTAVLALGEHQISLGRGEDIRPAVQYLRDVYSRHTPGMGDEQAEAILSVAFDGKAE